MPPASASFDFFVSYARADNATGWISRFIEELQEEQRRFTGGREFRLFFDKSDIRSLDDWRHRLHESLAASRLLVAFISPNYFASEWCRREWRTWIDIEIAQHVLSDGAAPVYIVEVPWLASAMSEQEVAKAIDGLSNRRRDAGHAPDVIAVSGQIAQRQLTQVRPFYGAGLDALRREDLRKVLASLARDLAERSEHVRVAADSRSTIPPYNRRFVGRLEELTLLRERLHQGRTGVISGHKGDLPGEKSVVASVHGLGGIGKTELAFTYAHAFAGLYPGGRFLIPCERLADLRLALLQLDSVFPNAATDEQRKSLDLHFGAIREALRERLGQMGRILLLLDNVSDPALLAPEQTDLIRILGSQLHLLATTRLGAPVGQGADDDVHWLTLGELTFEDSLRLLEKHRPILEAEREAADKIARRLGGFALCVEVVGAYLCQHPEEGYASFLKKMGLEDLEHVDAAAERKETVTRRHNNEKRVGAILALTLANLTDTERIILEFAALLPADHIVLPWLKELGSEHLTTKEPSSGQPDLFLAVVRRLFSLALLTRTQDADGHRWVVRCHRLVQDYVRSSRRDLTNERQQAIHELATKRAAMLQIGTDWQNTKWELPPLSALAAQWDEADHPQAAQMLGNLGALWLQLAEWTRAEPMLRRAVEICENPDGKSHEGFAAGLNNLAAFLLTVGRTAEAEVRLRQALEVNEKNLGPGHVDVATNCTNLAEVLRRTNRLAEAESLMRRALATNEQGLGREHPEVATNLGNLAMLLVETKRAAEAEPLMRRALAIDRRNVIAAGGQVLRVDPEPGQLSATAEEDFGISHPKVATDLSNLGLLLMATQRLEEAEKLFREALSIDEQSFGQTHPNVARDLNNLAELLSTNNQLEEAEQLLRRAIAINEASFGPENPHVGANLSILGPLLHASNRWEEAERVLRRLAEILLRFTRDTGHEHPQLRGALQSYARILADLGLKKPEIHAKLTGIAASFEIRVQLG